MCDFPYYENNNKCVLYSRYDYNTYINTLISFTVFNSLGILLSFIVNYLHYKKNNQIKIKNYILLLLSFSFILLTIQFTDPFGFDNRISHLTDVLLSNLSTWCSLSIIAIIYINFIKLFEHIDFKDKTLIRIYIYLIISFLITIFFSFMQVYINRHIWRGCKLIFFAIINFTITLLISKYYFKFINLIKNSNSNFINTNRLNIINIVFLIIISIVSIIQITLGIISITFNNNYIDYQINYKNLLLPIFHLICNYFAIIYFSLPVIKLSSFTFSRN